MRYEYYFYRLYTRRLEEYLQSKHIKYEGNVSQKILKFSVWSTDENYRDILDELQTLKVGDPIVYASYSATDLKQANFLTIRPKKQTINIINRETAYNYACRLLSSMGVEKVKHEEQIDTFVIGKEPSTKSSTAFWSCDMGFSELFTDRRVYELVNNYSLDGIRFEKVMNRKREYSENIFQMKSSNIIPRDCIIMEHGESKKICPICGEEQFFIDNAYQLHLDLSKIKGKSDFYMTEKIWGSGIAYPLYIISQRFYQLLKQNKLAGGIALSPVVWVNKLD